MKNLVSCVLGATFLGGKITLSFNGRQAFKVKKGMGRCLKSYWVFKYSKVQFRHSVFTPQNIFFICCSEHSVLGISQEKSCECSESNIFHILGGSNSNIFQYLKQE